MGASAGEDGMSPKVVDEAASTIPLSQLSSSVALAWFAPSSELFSSIGFFAAAVLSHPISLSELSSSSLSFFSKIFFSTPLQSTFASATTACGTTVSSLSDAIDSPFVAAAGAGVASPPSSLSSTLFLVSSQSLFALATLTCASTSSDASNSPTLSSPSSSKMVIMSNLAGRGGSPGSPTPLPFIISSPPPLSHRQYWHCSHWQL
mmetsp:Transcript_4303/g.9260  ORF Transcript_4303/g.9260 Transcript_4303/m.9260 type:complete len:205 (+) Transcript_4303:434-1048(+)